MNWYTTPLINGQGERVAVNGNDLYIVGTESLGFNSTAIWIRKMDIPSASTVWTKNFNSGTAPLGRGRDVAVDPATGDIYVLGLKKQLIPYKHFVWVQKLTSSGTSLWTKEIENYGYGPRGGISFATGSLYVLPDVNEVWRLSPSTGDIIAEFNSAYADSIYDVFAVGNQFAETGRYVASPTVTGLYAAKRSGSTGSYFWHAYDNVDRSGGYGVSMPTTLSVYVTGTSDVLRQTNYPLTEKRDGVTGALVWTRSESTRGQGNDLVTVSNSQPVFVAGEKKTGTTGNYKIWVQKYCQE